MARYLPGERHHLGVRSAQPPTSYLFQNNRDGTFTDVTQKGRSDPLGVGQACCVGDSTTTASTDLFVTCWGRNVLYRNNGDGTFTDVSEKAGVAGSRGAGARAAAFSITIATARRPVRCELCQLRSGQARHGPASRLSAAIMTSPFRAAHWASPAGRTSCIAIAVTAPSRTCRSLGESPDRADRRHGLRRRELAAHRLVRHGACGRGLRQRWLARTSYVACDNAPSLLYRNNRDGTFREVAVPAGCAFDEDGVPCRHGRGVGDYDGDGRLTSSGRSSGQAPTLYRNYGEGFVDSASSGARGRSQIRRLRPRFPRLRQ